MSKTAAIAECPSANALQDESSPEQISAYFLELERLLDRIERASTHYQTLGLERSATLDLIRLAYQEAVSLLYPPYKVSASLPASLALRVDRCFNKASQAFFALASVSRRKQYDAAPLSLAGKLLLDQSISHKSGERSSASSDSHSAPSAQEQEISINRLPSQREVYKEFSKDATGDNRRRCERHKLSIPVLAVGWDRKDGKWQEMAETINVSRTGITIRLHKQVRLGTVLFLTLPLPVKLRSHGYSDSSYKTYALVRRVEPPKKGVRVVGLEFLGEHPPAGLLKMPWAVFRTGKWKGTERRRAPRKELYDIVRIEYLSESGQTILCQEARTENISRNGLRVMVRAAPLEFDLVKVINPQRGFESFATVRNRYVAKDGLERLCLQFIANQWPL